MRGVPGLGALLLGLLTPALALAAPQEQTVPGNGQVLKMRMGGQETHRYKLILHTGQFLRVRVEQLGIDLVLQLQRADGKTLEEVDSPNGTEGPESFACLIEADGTYDLIVRPGESDVQPGEYELQVTQIAVPSEQEKQICVVDRWQRQVLQLIQEAHYDEALLVAQKATTLAEALATEHHLVLATALERQARVLLAQGKPSVAVPLLERAQRLRAAQPLADGGETAQTLADLAELYRQQRQFDRAFPLQQEALAGREKRYGLQSLLVAQSRIGLALLHHARDEFQAAELLLRQALTTYELRLKADDPDIAMPLTHLADLARASGNPGQAETLYLRALKLRSDWNKEHPYVAQSLESLAELYFHGGRYQEAESHYLKARAIFTKALGNPHRDTRRTVKNLALLYFTLGDYPQAEALWKEVLQLEKTLSGEESLETAVTLNNLATIHFNQADYPQAEDLYRQALQIRTERLGVNHPDVAKALANLAELYRLKGDYPQAQKLYQQALQIGPAAAAHKIQARNGLAAVASDQGNFALAEKLWQEVADQCQRTLGAKHKETAQAWNNLAEMYRVQGRFAPARTLYQRALTAYEAAVGTNHLSVGLVWQNLGNVYRAEKQFSRAETAYRKTETIFAAQLNPNHPAVAHLVTNLARFYLMTGRSSEATASYTRALTINEHNFSRNLFAGSERQQAAYLTLFLQSLNDVLTLQHQATGAQAETLNLALQAVLTYKGRGLEELTTQYAQLRQVTQADVQGEVEKLFRLRKQVAMLSLQGRDALEYGNYRTTLQQLETQMEEMEASLSRRVNTTQQPWQTVTAAALPSLLPPQTELLEFVQYAPLDLATGQATAPRYAAFLVGPAGAVRWVDLGLAAPIDRAILAFREALQGRKREDYSLWAQRVHALVFAPLQPFLPATQHLLVAPDGLLNLLPFAALMDDKGRYLVQQYTVSYLTSGRELFRARTAANPTTGIIVLADPDFGDNAAATAATRDLIPTKQSGTTASTSPGSKDKAARNPFSPLPGTAAEAQALRDLLPAAQVLTGLQATESALKQVQRPQILHIATHGFFLQDAVPPRARRRGEAQRDLVKVKLAPEVAFPTTVSNPLFRSGLALAGANLRQAAAAQQEDGILTALEAAGLDLWGTKLVVLSACDTGVGEIKNGEGVYGLRRAFALAGSEAQVMSLWPVSDVGTKELMVKYYQRLLKGEGRGEALRQVQLAFLKNPQRKHPFYWASFIHSGEWANLDGKRP